MSSNTPKTGAVATPARDQRYQPHTQKITTFLWFDNNAEEAANFYVSVFKNSRILKSVLYGDVGPGPKGAIMIIDFELDGAASRRPDGEGGAAILLGHSA